MIYQSPRPQLRLPDGPLTPYVFEHRARYADRPAFIEPPTGRTRSYGATWAAVERTAGGLAARGFRHGSVLGILAANCADYGIAFHAVALAGGAATTINPAYKIEEVVHQLRDSGARWLICDRAAAGVAHAAAQQVGNCPVFCFDGTGDESFAALSAGPLAQVPVMPDDIVALPYSSGTTGLSKGVVLTHRNCAGNIAQIAACMPLRPQDIFIAVLPFFHIYGMQVIMNLGLRIGATLVTMPRFDLAAFLDAIQRYQVTIAFVVPPIVLALAKHPLVEKFDLSSLRFMMSGAAPLGADVAAEAQARIKVPIIQGYGMTELSPVSHLSVVGATPAGSVGQLAPGSAARLVDPETGRDAANGASGELWVRGPMVMKGYLNNPAATAATLDADGWLHTGDIARVDDASNFYIVDRLKALIKYKGFQVAPAVLEALLLTHPDVADAAVIGTPDAEAGELPKAFIVRKAGATVAAATLRAFVAGHVATYKQIHEVEFVEAIPKSPSGKILRRLLRDRGVSRS